MMTILERPFAVKVYRVINKYSIKASKAAAAIGSGFDISLTLDGMSEELGKIYKPHYQKVMNTFGMRTLKGLKSCCDVRETKNEDIFLSSIDDYILTKTADKVKYAVNTTKDQIADAVSVSVSESLGQHEMAKLIREKTGGTIAKNRSVVIARTETHMAAQEANLRAAKSTGIPELRKVWIASYDESTRKEHIACDDETHKNPILMDAMFEVGSDSMDSPGNGSDPAMNVNCRCIIGYDV